MTKGRLEAFSDGVIAIIITIMVLELKVPHNASWLALLQLLPGFVSYVLSFLMLAIFWGNHHHLLHAAKEVNSKILWANIHLLFWLSLIPFGSGWMGENDFKDTTVAMYAIILNCSGIAYFILLWQIKKSHPDHAALQKPLKKQTGRGWLSCISYTAAIPLAYVHAAISGAIFLFVAVLWLVPDRNIEKTLAKDSGEDAIK
jgi:uncharacterized membrane protein